MSIQLQIHKLNYMSRKKILVHIYMYNTIDFTGKKNFDRHFFNLFNAFTKNHLELHCNC